MMNNKAISANLRKVIEAGVDALTSKVSANSMKLHDALNHDPMAPSLTAEEATELVLENQEISAQVKEAQELLNAPVARGY